jgi:phytoene synthase
VRLTLRYCVGMISPNPEQKLALSYASPETRQSLKTLFSLDETLGAIVRTTREPIIGQMRLTWWYEALGRLDTVPAPAEPVLAALQNEVLPFGVSGAMLGKLTDGWEALLEPDLDAGAIERFARDRGRRLFDLAATIVSVTDGRERHSIKLCRDDGLHRRALWGRLPCQPGST